MKKKLLTLALALTLLCGITIWANAVATLQEIKAYLNNSITVTLEGQPQTLVDAGGNRVIPITYNGTTYLPVRAVAGLVGLEVEWDQATQTVKLNAPKGIDLIDTYKFYNSVSGADRKAVQVQSSSNKKKDISGISYDRWLELYIGWNIEENATSYASFNVEGKYNTVTFKYYSDKDTTLRVLGDNDVVLFEKSVTGGQVAQTATVQLNKTTQLTFLNELSGRQNYGTDTYIFDVSLDAQ